MLTAWIPRTLLALQNMQVVLTISNLCILKREGNNEKPLVLKLPHKIPENGHRLDESKLNNLLNLDLKP